MRWQETRAGGFQAPAGDPAAVRAAALRFRAVSGRALATAGVRGDAGADLALFWSGPAAQAAQDELATLASRARRLLPQLAAAGLALYSYADALEHAIRVSRRLRIRASEAREEHARLVAIVRATAVDPAVAAVGTARADQELADQLMALHRVHGRVMDEFMAAGAACARTLSQLTAEATSGASVPTATAASEAVLQGLPLAREQIRLASVRPAAKVAPRPEPAWWETAVQKAGEAGAWTWNHTAVPLVNGAANVAEAVSEHPEDLVEMALGTGMIVLGGTGMAGGTALDATGVGAVAGVPIQFAAAAVTATGVAAASHGAGDLLGHAARKDNRLLKEVENWRGKSGEELPDSWRPPAAGSNWKGRVAEGDGEVWQDPAWIGVPNRGNLDVNSLRIMDPTPDMPHGYVRFHNRWGQPIDLNGKPTGPRQTHIPIRADGTYEIPAGWNPS